jgi:riboflavin kinase/FMN adenylyltransferase
VDNWKSVADRPSDYASLAVAIGKFDALHLGHQALLNELVEAAENHGLAPAVITFDRHPAATLTPEAAPTPIIGKSQKENLLTEAGISAILTLEFNDELAALSPRQFVERVLVPLDTKYVVVGDDFRFGSNGSGTVATLRELGSEFGFAVKSVAKVNALGTPISTSRIRNLLDEGEVDQVAKLLGRPHLTTGVIEHGLKIGRTIGFPTANMSRDAEGYLPRDGVYAGWLYADGQRYPAAHSVGINETFQAVPRLVESHVLDRDDLDLYDKVVSLEYIDFIRPNVKFNSKEELIEAINKDLDQVRKALGICW